MRGIEKANRSQDVSSPEWNLNLEKELQRAALVPSFFSCVCFFGLFLPCRTHEKLIFCNLKEDGRY